MTSLQHLKDYAMDHDNDEDVDDVEDHHYLKKKPALIKKSKYSQLKELIQEGQENTVSLDKLSRDEP